MNMNAKLFAAAFLLCACAAAQAVDAQPPLRLDDPAGGWNVFGFVDHAEEMAAAWPTPPVVRGRQKNRTLIRGRFAPVEEGKRPPPKLIVNGNAMPLYGNPDGTFARPYAFGRGSNSVEIRSADGKMRRRVQFYEASTGRPQARIRIICSWDDAHAEVDMHIITPDGQHAYFAEPVLNTGGGLDVDSVDGAGPEMFSTTSPMQGMYHVYVNYWGNFGAAGYNFDAAQHDQTVVTTQITMIFDENTPNERRETRVVPLRRIGDLTLVSSFNYP